MAYGYADDVGYDYGASQDAFLQQQEADRLRLEEERRRQEEDARRLQEEEARRAAEAQAQAAQQQAPQPQPGQTLGELMMPPGPDPQANAYDPQPQPGPPMAPMPEPEPAPPPLPAPTVPQPERDYTAQPLTGAELDAVGGNPHIQGATRYYGGSAFPMGTPAPDRKTSSMDLDQFNREIRSSELYQQFVHERGLWKPHGRVVEWSERDRDDWKRTLEQSGVQVDGGMKVDNAGNLNQKNLLGKRLAKIGIIAGGVAATIATGGAASPWLATAIGAGTGAGTGAIDGGLKGALIGAGVGAAGGYALGGGRLPGIGGGAGARAASSAATTVTKDVGKEVVKQAAAKGMSASIMPHVITGLAGLGTAYMGQRAQNKANERAMAADERAGERSERSLTAQMEYDREQRKQDRADADRRWDAEQAFARQQWDASQEDRLFQRNIFLEDRAAKAAERAAALAARGSGGGGGGGGGGVIYSGPSGPSEAELRKQRARANVDALLRQGTPGMPNSYVAATAAGPTGRG